MNARQLWEILPNAARSQILDGFELYRDGEILVQLEERTGREREIKFETFRRYVTRARKGPAQ